jgi:F5/8 type C domain
MTTSDGDAGLVSRLRANAPTAVMDRSPAEKPEAPASPQIAPNPTDHHRDVRSDRLAASDFDDFWSEPRSPREPRPTPLVVLLARLAGVLAVAFAVVAIVVVHSTGSRRLAGDLITPARTNSGTVRLHPKTGRAVLPLTHARRHIVKHRSHPSDRHKKTVSPVRVGISPPASPVGSPKPRATRHSPLLSASQTLMAFGRRAVGATGAVRAVTMTNSGTAVAAISSIAVTGPFTQTNNCGTRLSAFSPATTGKAAGTLTVASNVPSRSLAVSLSGTGTASAGTGTNLAQGKAITASSSLSAYPASNANDGNTSTYWESLDGSGFPQTLTVDLGTTTSISRIVLDLPPLSDWGTRTQTLSVLGRTSGKTYSTLVASASYTFDWSTGNTVTITLPARASARFVRLRFTGNSGWPAAQVSEFEIFGR